VGQAWGYTLLCDQSDAGGAAGEGARVMQDL